jgi:hypothetical protein
MALRTYLFNVHNGWVKSVAYPYNNACNYKTSVSLLRANGLTPNPSLSNPSVLLRRGVKSKRRAKSKVKSKEATP